MDFSCAAFIHMYRIAMGHNLIPQLPEEARNIAIICCRIIRGINIIDPTEPSVTAIWYLSGSIKKLTETGH